MRQEKDNLFPFHGVVSGGKATCEIILPEPGRIHTIELYFESDNVGTVERRPKATMLAQVNNVEFFLNNKPQRDQTIAKVFEDWEMRKGVVQDGVIPIPFSRDERNLQVERDATALFGGVGDDVRITVDLGVSTTPGLIAHVVWEPFNSNGVEGSLTQIMDKRGGRRQLIETIRSDTVNVAKTGTLNLNLQGEGRDLSCVKLRTTDCDYIEIYRGVDLKWEGSPADYDRWLEREGYVKQAGVIHFFPEAWGGGSPANWYQYRGKQLIFKLNMTAAVSFDIDIHEVGAAIR